MIKIEFLFINRRQFYDNRYGGFLKADLTMMKKSKVFLQIIILSFLLNGEQSNKAA